MPVLSGRHERAAAAGHAVGRGADLRAGHEAAVQAVRAALGDQTYAAWAEGRALPLEAAVALALAGYTTAPPGE